MKKQRAKRRSIKIDSIGVESADVFILEFGGNLGGGRQREEKKKEKKNS